MLILIMDIKAIKIVPTTNVESNRSTTTSRPALFDGNVVLGIILEITISLTIRITIEKFVGR